MRWIVPAITILLSGCGTVVPDIQEFWGTPNDASEKVEQISSQVVCELRRAVQKVLWEDKHRNVVVSADPLAPQPHFQHLDWFEHTWGVQVTLNLNIAENSGVSPGISFVKNFNSAESFTAGLGASLTSTATRTDKLNMFFTVEGLAKGYKPVNLPCIDRQQANATLFLESDLKLYDWLHAALLPNFTNIVAYQSSTSSANVIQHEVKFEIVSNGNVTPSWKLVTLTANTSGTFLSAGRDRTQDLTITFGPLAQYNIVSSKSHSHMTAHNLELATPAENAHLAAEIGLAVSQALKGLQ